MMEFWIVFFGVSNILAYLMTGLIVQRTLFVSNQPIHPDASPSLLGLD